MEIVTITEARRRLDGALPSYEAKIEYVTPNQALGRITARDITAACDYPPYRKSPFDGYALCSHEKKGYDVIATIGAGIFATTGTAIVGDALRPGAGPAIILSFLLTALACGFAALCYAEFAAMVPIAGSAYTYGYAVLGEVVGWFIGWDLLLEYTAIVAVVAIGAICRRSTMILAMRRDHFSSPNSRRTRSRASSS